MACISLGKIDKSLIVIIIGCVFCFLNRLLNIWNPYIYKFPILTNICIAISRFLAVIPFIILKIKLKNINGIQEKEITNNKLTELIYNDSKDELIIQVQDKWKYLLLSAIVNIGETISFALSSPIKTNSWIWYILFATLFYYLIFKIQIYRHHYLSGGLILVMGLIIDFILENLQNEISNFRLYLKFLKDIFTSFYLVLAKYVMEKKYVSVYGFSFYIGAFNLIVLLIFEIFDYFFFKLTDYNEFFSEYNYKELLLIIGVIITQFVINITTLFTTKNNSPCHAFIILVFGQIAYYVNIDKKAIIINIILIIILFLSLIFNEIIEINLFGLSYNTKRNIMIRAMDESQAKKETDNESDCDSNNENESKNTSKNGSFAEIYGNGEIVENEKNLEKSLNNDFIDDENNNIKI